MRWSLRRADQGQTDQHAADGHRRDADPGTPPPVQAGDPPSTVALVAAGWVSDEPAWRAVAPLPPTWSSRTPLTTPVHQVDPPLLRARPLPVNADSTGHAPAPGRVIGLAAVIPTAPVLEPPVRAPLPAYVIDQPPLRHVAARPLSAHAPLTEVTPGSVGEPVAPTPAPKPVAPAAPSQFARPPTPGSDAAAVATTEAGARFREALAALRQRGDPDSLPGQRRPDPLDPAQTPPAAPLPVEPERPRAVRPSPDMPHRRATLAQSRRLGLGAPLDPDSLESHEPLTHPPTPAPPAAEAPAPPAAAPAPPPAPPDTAPPVVDHPADTGAGTATRARSRSARRASDGDATDDDTHRGDTRDDEGGATPAAESRPHRPAPLPVLRPTPVPTHVAARTTPLVFRAATRRDVTAPSVATITRTPERVVITRPPAELAQALQRSHGIDVRDVPVRRDAEAAAEARQRGARGFTRGGTVHLPDDPSPSAAARGLLAHELVHAAQQRRLGGNLPAEDTAEGRALEAEAVAAEQMYAQTSRLEADVPLVHSPVPVTASWVEERIVQHAPIDSPPAPTIPPSLEPMRQDIERVADHSARRVVAEWTNPSITPVPGAPVHVPGLNPPAPPGMGGPAAMPVASGRTSATAIPLAQQAVPDEGAREQAYLDILNSQRTRDGQQVRSDLTPEEREQMYDVFGPPGSGMGALGAGRPGAAAAAEPEAPTTMHWEAGRGFVSSGPGAAAATAGARSAWGDNAVFAAIGANLNPDAAPTAGASTTTPRSATPGAAAPGVAPTPGAPGTGLATSGAAVGTDPEMVQAPSMADALSNLFGSSHDSHPAAATPARSGAAVGGAAAGAAAPGGTAGGTAAAIQAAHDAALGPVDAARIDMEQLSVRMYDHLRRRLRQELLVDRERAGLLTDYR